MNPLNTLRAVRAVIRLKLADRALEQNSQREQRAGITRETPAYWHLNDRVAAALSDPHLPIRFREPADTWVPCQCSALSS